MEPKKLKLLLPHIFIIVFLILYTAFLSYKVTVHSSPFYDWDESIYVQVGKEMVQKKSLVPLWEGQAWLEKPPLAPLFYGVIISYLPLNPEITTRIASIILATVMLCLLYLFVLKVQKNWLFATLVTVLTALNPLVLHRSQIVNTDVFLLIGWLGYFLFFRRFWPGLLFLAIGVYSKSILGFYPIFFVFIYELYVLWAHKKNPELYSQLKKMTAQVAILLIWYLGMLAVYRQTFIQVHFADHLLKRVTTSIEQHYGLRTYYIDLAISLFGFFFYLVPVSALLAVVQFFKKKITENQLLYTLALLPWFIFLNLAKTKIEWYLYPAIPGLVLLILYPLTLLQKWPVVKYGIMSVILLFVIYSSLFGSNLLNENYSAYGDIYQLARASNKNCTELNILVDQNARKDHAVLSSQNDLISTSDIYGQFPSLMYYTEKKVNPFYDVNLYLKALSTARPGSCWSFDENDSNISRFSSLKYIIKIGPHLLYKKV
jgi:4-amino-4-deoxy-L-arabinose transferase-like glycosyltransferase